LMGTSSCAGIVRRMQRHGERAVDLLRKLQICGASPKLTASRAGATVKTEVVEKDAQRRTTARKLASGSPSP